MKIIKFIKRNLKLITIITVMIIISAIAIVKYSLLQSEEVEVIEDTSLLLEEQEQLDEEPSEENIPVVEKIFVDIKGEVALPGVYEIENNKKVIDQRTTNMIPIICRTFERNPLILGNI